jgi:hypothetical protein
MSQDDLRTLGNSLGLGEVLDNPESMRFNGNPNQAAGTSAAFPLPPTSISSGLIGGNGLVNNSVFTNSPGYQLNTTQTCASIAGSINQTLSVANTNIQVGQLVTGPGIIGGTTVVTIVGTALTLSQAATAVASVSLLSFFTFASGSQDQTVEGIQYSGSVNNGYYSRIKKYSDFSNGTFQNLYGQSSANGISMVNIMSQTQSNMEFKPYTYVNGNYIITYDICVIRLCDIFDSMKNLPLMKKFDGVLKLYINTGCVSSIIQEGGYMITSGSSNTFNSTCPLVQSCLVNTPASAVGLTSGLFIAKATQTNSFGVNLASSSATNVMPACRIYFPQISLKPERLIPYISENRNKKIVYTDILFNQFNNIGNGNTFSALVQSGVSNIRGVLIVPFISSTIYGSVNTNVSTGTTLFSQYQSPYDMSPNTNGPLSLLNLQIQIGGVNQLANTLNYSFENFLQQVSLYEKINQGDLGFSCGLVNEYYWNNCYRTYYVDCTRANISDQMSPRNVNISFTNNTNANIDIFVFTEYFTEIVVDVETGLVTK